VSQYGIFATAFDTVPEKLVGSNVADQLSILHKNRSHLFYGKLLKQKDTPTRCNIWCFTPGVHNLRPYGRMWPNNISLIDGFDIATPGVKDNVIVQW